MKKFFALFVLVFFAGLFLNAQIVSYTVKTSAKCTNLTAGFTVPAGKVANIKSLDVVPTFKSCNTAAPDLSSIVVSVRSTPLTSSTNRASETSSSKNKGVVVYKKTLEKTGLVTESVDVTTVKLLQGTYVIEVSPSAGTEATLTIELFDN